MPTKKKSTKKTKKNGKASSSQLWKIGWSASDTTQQSLVLNGVMVVLAPSSAKAKKLAATWMQTKQPWSLLGPVQEGVGIPVLQSPVKITEFYGYGDNPNGMPRFWQIT